MRNSVTTDLEARKARAIRLKAISFDRNIGHLASRVAQIIFSYVNRKSGAAWPSQKRLAMDLGVTDKSIRNALAELVRRGHIEVERYRGAGCTNIVRFVPATEADVVRVREPGSSLPVRAEQTQTNLSESSADKLTSPSPDSEQEVGKMVPKKVERDFRQNYVDITSLDKVGRHVVDGLFADMMTFDEFLRETEELLSRSASNNKTSCGS